jgi:hypothetical protein
MDAPLLKETREQEQERERLDDLIVLTEDRRLEMIAISNLLSRIQANLEKMPFRSGVSEVKSLRTLLALPMENGKLAWSPQWGFNQVLRAIDRINCGEHKQWITSLMKDLE